MASGNGKRGGSATNESTVESKRLKCTNPDRISIKIRKELESRGQGGKGKRSTGRRRQDGAGRELSAQATCTDLRDMFFNKRYLVPNLAERALRLDPQHAKE